MLLRGRVGHRGSAELAANLLAPAASDAIASSHFGVVPFFVLMGFLAAEAGLGRDAFDVANALFRRLRGGLGVGTVGADAILAAITGISIASAAVFTRIAVPQMIRHGYARRFAVDVVAGSSVLGMLIPPSLLLILYGIVAEQAIGALFLAGIGPGLLTTALSGLGVVVAAPVWPARVRPQAGAVPEGLSGPQVAAKGLPIAALVPFVLGGLYGGPFTPVEAGAMGAIGALAIGAAKRRLTPAGLGRVLVETGLVTAAMCFLIVAAQMDGRMLAFSGMPAGIGAFAAQADLGSWGPVALYLGAVVAMGTILDSSAILLIVVPLILPVVQPMGIDLVWFGIVTVIAVEIGLLTTPFGISVYVIHSALDDPSIPLSEISAGAAPFALIMLIVLGLAVAFPPIATALLREEAPWPDASWTSPWPPTLASPPTRR